jgi:hypothetical protein
MPSHYHRKKAALAKIKIKPENKGKLHEDTGTPMGEKIPLSDEESLKSSGTPAEKKRANFAINAKKWGK